MAAPWIPKFRYPTSSGTVLTLTRSQRPWSQPVRTIGGFRESASGTARASRLIRRDRLLEQTIRFDEAETASVRAMVEWAQSNPSTGIDVWPSAASADSAIVFVCYLVSPVIGEDWSPQRVQDFLSDFESTLIWRRTNGGAFDLAWFPD